MCVAIYLQQTNARFTRLSMDRIIRNNSFLRKLQTSRKKTLIYLIKEANEAEIKALYEIIYNLKNFEFEISEKKVIQTKLQKLGNFFRSHWSLKKLKRFLLSNVTLIPFLIDIIFTKLH